MESSLRGDAEGFHKASPSPLHPPTPLLFLNTDTSQSLHRKQAPWTSRYLQILLGLRNSRFIRKSGILVIGVWLTDTKESARMWWCTCIFPKRASGMRLAQAEIKSRNLFSISHGLYLTWKICRQSYPQRFQRAPIKKGKQKGGWLDTQTVLFCNCSELWLNCSRVVSW